MALYAPGHPLFHTVIISLYNLNVYHIFLNLFIIVQCYDQKHYRTLMAAFRV